MAYSRDKSTAFSKTSFIQCGDKIIQLKEAVIMGILNITPDSFHDGGRYDTKEKYLQRVGQMLEEGAEIIDIGAVSTRPRAKDISLKEETDRLVPALKAITSAFPRAILSVDTYRAEIAHIAAENGAGMINYISGGRMDAGMFKTVAGTGLPYVMMHMQGTPQTMQKNPVYKDLIGEIREYFSASIETAKNEGISQLILDPGFGFGKTLEQNYAILNHLEQLRTGPHPLLVGVSRKSMIYKLLNSSPEEALHGTAVLHTLALLNGANILRVHDVKEAVQVRKLVGFYHNQGNLNSIPADTP
ncbi:MAG: dihydropteroate synthase [Bacteroidales bacterium]|nr:dihydropteroate synthase [Bacteroidales bacterium]